LEELLSEQAHAGVTIIEHYKMYLLKERLIFENLNKLVMKSNLLIGYFWCADQDKTRLRDCIGEMTKDYPNFAGVEVKKIKTGEKRPTSFNLNDFSKPFQLLVDMYGTPRYKEINPALFTITTFPFIFGIMYGDIGHGAILFTFGLALLFFSDPDKTSNSIMLAARPFRYLIVLMGFFAMYCGFVYNDFFAIPTTLFGTCYQEKGTHLVKEHNCVPSFGLDPVWGKASNEITFSNSFKMKLSIVLGVTHMLLGIFLKGANALYFSSMVDFCFEFVPQLVFMTCTFGYMVILIILKWTKNWDKLQPPSILDTFINFVTKVQPFLIRWTIRCTPTPTLNW
jgi:V-type H+-transporting ATPase subunit a